MDCILNSKFPNWKQPGVRGACIWNNHLAWAPCSFRVPQQCATQATCKCIIENTCRRNVVRPQKFYFSPKILRTCEWSKVWVQAWSARKKLKLFFSFTQPHLLAFTISHVLWLIFPFVCSTIFWKNRTSVDRLDPMQKWLLLNYSKQPH